MISSIPDPLEGRSATDLALFLVGIPPKKSTGLFTCSGRGSFTRLRLLDSIFDPILYRSKWLLATRPNLGTYPRSGWASPASYPSFKSGPLLFSRHLPSCTYTSQSSPIPYLGHDASTLASISAHSVHAPSQLR